MTQNRAGTKFESDADEEGILTDALMSPAADRTALERVRAAVQQEWVAAVSASARRRRSIVRRWGLTLAAAAGIAALAVGVQVFRSDGETEVAGSVARLNGGGAEVRPGLLRHRALGVGDVLHVGDVLVTRGPALLTLAGGGTLRIGGGSTLKVTQRAQLSLEAGLIYVDLPPEASSSPLRILTRAGVIEHLGTEFEVMSDRQMVRIRVREGRIRVMHGSAVWVADAGTELVSATRNEFALRPFSTAGRDWNWISAVAPDYSIDGQPLIEFLRWSSRESGRTLNFADAHARDVADTTVLHGSLHGQAPLDALPTVLATTSLTYELRGDSIWVRSSS